MFGFLIGVIATLIALIVISASGLFSPFSSLILNNLPVFQAIGPLAVAGSAIIAFFLYRSNLKRHEKEDRYKASKTFLEESIKIIERSYEMFTDDGSNVRPPKNDRLLWLATARMILRFKKLRSRISEAEQIEIIDEHEEYWRFQFYKLLNENQGNFTNRYFNPGGNPHNPDCVSRRSIAVIFDFAKWRVGAVDPMDEVNDKILRGQSPFLILRKLELKGSGSIFYSPCDRASHVIGRRVISGIR